MIEHAVVEGNSVELLNNYIGAFKSVSWIIGILFAIALFQIIRKRKRMRKDMKIMRQIDRNRQQMYNSSHSRNNNVQISGNANGNNQRVIISDKIIEPNKKGRK